MVFDIAIVRSDDGLTEVRVAKLCESLSKKYNVLLLGWNRYGKLPHLEHLGRRLTVCRFRMKLEPIPTNRAYCRIIPTLVFAFWVLRQLLLTRPRMTYACDEDAAIPCFTYKLITHIPFVFDVFDRFSFAINGGLTRMMLASIEEFLASKTDLFITNSIALLRSFAYKPRNFEIVMNCPEDKRPTRTSRAHCASSL